MSPDAVEVVATPPAWNPSVKLGDKPPGIVIYHSVFAEADVTVISILPETVTTSPTCMYCVKYAVLLVTLVTLIIVGVYVPLAIVGTFSVAVPPSEVLGEDQLNEFELAILNAIMLFCKSPFGIVLLAMFVPVIVLLAILPPPIVPAAMSLLVIVPSRISDVVTASASIEKAAPEDDTVISPLSPSVTDC
jgi:hypothetical protein